MAAYRLNLLWVILAASCSNADLYTLDPPLSQPSQHIDRTAKIHGTYCAASPESLVFPVKILLIIDDSSSMTRSDPNFRRLAAARQLVDTLLPKPGVFIGVENFLNAEPKLLTTDPIFTRDRDQLTNALLDSPHTPSPWGGNTPYLGALSLGLKTIQTDILADIAAASRTRYIILMISDGAPTDEGAPYEQIKLTAKAIKALEQAANRGGKVTIHTAFVRNPSGDPLSVNSSQQGIELLTEIAKIGMGQFRNFENNEQIDFRQFDVSPLVRDHRTYSSIIVTNLTAQLTQAGYETDSDGDGLMDAEEKQIGTDPGKADTDGDGCSDLHEDRYFRWDPLVSGRTSPTPHCECTDEDIKLDTDGDLINNCAERLLAMNPKNPDSDQDVAGNLSPDNMHDYLEVLNNLGRIKNDADSDYDSDGQTNLEELTRHLNPSWDEGEDKREQYGYEYDIEPLRGSGKNDCYEFTVGNVALVPTARAEGHQAGENILMLYYAEGPQDNPYAENTMRVLYVPVVFNANDTQGQNVEIRPDQFQILAPPGKP